MFYGGGGVRAAATLQPPSILISEYAPEYVYICSTKIVIECPNISVRDLAPPRDADKYIFMERRGDGIARL